MSSITAKRASEVLNQPGEKILWRDVGLISANLLKLVTDIIKSMLESVHGKVRVFEKYF